MRTAPFACVAWLGLAHLVWAWSTIARGWLFGLGELVQSVSTSNNSKRTITKSRLRTESQCLGIRDFIRVTGRFAHAVLAHRFPASSHHVLSSRQP